MTADIPVQEGTIPFAGYRTWYRVVGEDGLAGHLPVLLLHGGPAVPHGCLEPLEQLASTGRRLVFYDQLGCGSSAIPPNPSLWTIDLYRREIDAVRTALGLDRVHIFGHSWGGILAMEYALTQPAGLVSLVLSDTTASWAEYQSEISRLQDEVPAAVRETAERHQAAGTTDDPEYRQAASYFEQRHVLGAEQAPDYLIQAMQKRSEHPDVSQALDRQLQHWDITPRLAEIHVPALLLVGRHGILTPALSETIHQGIPGSELVVFEESAHFPYITETARYLTTVQHFLERVEHDRTMPE